MSGEVGMGNLDPEIVRPGMEGNGSGFLTVIKDIEAFALSGEDDPLKPFGKSIPFWNEIEERLNVSLGYNVTVPSSGLLAVENVALMSGRLMAILFLHPAVFDFGRSAGIGVRVLHNLGK